MEECESREMRSPENPHIRFKCSDFSSWLPWMILVLLLCILSHFSCVRLFATSWTIAHQAPLSMGFPRQEYWSGLPCPPPGDLPHPGMETTSPVSPTFQVDSLPLSCWGSPLYAHIPGIIIDTGPNQSPDMSQFGD